MSEMSTQTHNHNSSEPRDRPIGQLFKQLSDGASTLVRKEIELAKAEMTEKGKTAGIGAGLLAGGALFGVFALACLTACGILALALLMPGWAAALIVGVVYLIGAAVCALVGKNRLKEAAPPAPEQTIETVKEDVRWAKAQLK